MEHQLAAPNALGSFSGFVQLGTPPAGQRYQADFSILGSGSKTEVAAITWNLTGT